MRLLLLFLALPLPLAAQESSLFPRFSITGGTSPASFETNARIDPETTLAAAGTEISLARPLGRAPRRGLPRFRCRCAPSRRHVPAASFFPAPRGARQQITRTITF